MSTIQNLIHKLKELHLDRNIVSYLICVVIASILWFMNALNKDYTAEISYPVKYVNFPAGKYPLSALPDQLQLEVKAKGFALLAHRVRTSFLPITFNVNTYCHLLQEDNNVWEYQLNTNDIKDRISNQLNSDIKLLNIYPEEILFRFGASKSKKIAVRPTVNYTLKRQYILNSITATPDSVTVTGPAIMIDTLQYIQTQPIDVKDVGKNLSKSAQLMALPNCSFDDKQTIDVDIRVEQFTEVKKTIGIDLLNVPDSMNIRLFPPQVDISYEIGLSKYEKVTDKDFIFTVHYPENTNTTYLEIKVTKAPSFIKNLIFTPQKVEYILEKK